MGKSQDRQPTTDSQQLIKNESNPTYRKCNWKTIVLL